MMTSFCPGGFAPPDPPTRSFAGAPGPAPLAWLTRCRSFASIPGGFAPPDPPTRSLAGAPGPAPLAWLTRCRSFASIPGGFAPPDPPTRSRLSLSTAAPATTEPSRLLQQRVAGRISPWPLRRLGTGHDIGDDLGAWLNLVGVEDFRVGAVRDAETQIHGLELLV